MKKPWMKRFAAAALAVTFTAGMGLTMLRAAEEEEIPGKSGRDEYVVLCPEISKEEFHRRVSVLRKETEHNEELNVSIGAVWDPGSGGSKSRSAMQKI